MDEALLEPKESVRVPGALNPGIDHQRGLGTWLEFQWKALNGFDHNLVRFVWRSNKGCPKRDAVAGGVRRSGSGLVLVEIGDHYTLLATQEWLRANIGDEGRSKIGRAH